MTISRFALTAATAMFVAGAAAAGFAQTSGAGATGGSAARSGSLGGMSASSIGTGANSISPGSASGVVGSGGSAAAGGTSASALGLGAESTTPTGSSSSLSTGGSAAAANGGHVMDRSGVHGNANNLNGQTMTQSHQPGGTWSKVHEHTKVHKGELTSRTKSMSHELGGPPVKSMTTEAVPMTGSSTPTGTTTSR